MRQADELARIRDEFQRRRADSRFRSLYSLFNLGNLLNRQAREREFLAALRAAGCEDLALARILEVGCGAAGELRRLVDYGARPERLHGIDLLWTTLVQGGRFRSGMPLVCGDASRLPYAHDTFDAVMQFTVFTSVLDLRMRGAMACEMLRVLKPEGLIVWYDFWLNPRNPRTRGIGPAEIRSLFPGCSVRLQRSTLAPPLARRVRSRTVFSALYATSFLRSHYLATIRKCAGVRVGQT